MVQFQKDEPRAALPELVERLYAERDLADGELKAILETTEFDQTLFQAADARRREAYGDEVYLRGLIEFTN